MTDNGASDKHSISSADLIAFADGGLDPERRLEVRRYLHDNPEAAEFVRACGVQNEALRKHFDPVVEEPIPERLLRAVVLTARYRASARVATATMFVLGALGGWLTHAYFSAGDAIADGLGKRAALAYSIYARGDAGMLDLVSSDPARVREWLARELGVAAMPPRLSDLGFELVGTRLMMGDDAPAGLLVYRRRDGRELVLFLRTDMARTAEARPEFRRERGLATAYWVHGGSGISLSGPLAEDEINAATLLVRSQWGS